LIQCDIQEEGFYETGQRQSKDTEIAQGRRRRRRRVTCSDSTSSKWYFVEIINHPFDMYAYEPHDINPK
jgi:hypothetical protein